MKKIIIQSIAITILFSCNAEKKLSTTANNSTMQKSTNTSLSETYWRLTELMGQPVTPSENNKKEMHLIIKKDGNVVFGHGGCNGFRGSYTLNEGTDRISFSQMASTLMACVNMEKEKQFLDVLSKVDSYAIKGNALSLNRARMAPLARFEAILMK